DSGFLVKGTYLFTVQQKETVAGTETTYTGDGFQVDLGYLFKLGASASVGPTLGYKTVTYKKAKSGSTEVDLSPTLKYTQMLLPGLQFAFVF
ncbi:MAG TPA: hypothetical protein VFV50_01160, partial [Bdellovibrionales bacterium]|nr:hypothetical protein [Bdellovibrionales bacterium]